MKTMLILSMILLLASGAAMTNAEDKSAGTGPKLEKATFAGGCFWCMQPPFDKLKGVVSTIVGYTGGHKPNPTYEEVSSGSTGHAESIEVTYDPALVSYDEILDVFWHNVDPTTRDRQFVDVGNQYRTAVFYHNEEQRKLALASKEKLEKSGKLGSKPIVTEIVPVSTFYPAEEYHQKYYQKSGVRYKFYRFNSGRDQYLKKTWGKSGGE
jgi:peptide-methionine (S)-S-oxide reductase